MCAIRHAQVTTDAATIVLAMSAVVCVNNAYTNIMIHVRKLAYQGLEEGENVAADNLR